MKLRNRLTILSTIIFGIMYALASTVVFIFFYNSSERIIFNELEQSSLLTAYFYLEEDELSQRDHQEIKKQYQETLQNAEVRIFNEQNIIKYGTEDADDAISNEVLNQVRKLKKFNFKDGDYYYSGIFYPDNQGDFVVFIKESNSFFKAQTNRLLLIMLIVLLVGLAAIFLLSRFLSKLAYRPVSDVISQVNNMQPENMEQLIKSPMTNDELQDLIETFNSLLSRISDTFIIQKNFINFVSHEFKTPLAAISGSLEVFAQRERSQEEYNQVVNDALQNVYQIEEILNTLLLVSGIKKNKSILENNRIDETLWEMVDKLTQQHPQTSLEIQIEIEASHQHLLKVNIPKSQLQLALYNILENAIKYAKGSKIEIFLRVKKDKLDVEVKDYGKGIAEKDLKNIAEPFYRGSNTNKISGSGIGLALASIIFKQNEIDMQIESKIDIGTSVHLLFPAMKD